MSDIRFKSNLCLVADKLDKETGNQEIRFTECTWVKDKNIMLWTSLVVSNYAGVQLVFFFCSGVSKLFGAQGSPSSDSLLNLLSPRF